MPIRDGVTLIPQAVKPPPARIETERLVFRDVRGERTFPRSPSCSSQPRALRSRSSRSSSTDEPGERVRLRSRAQFLAGESFPYVAAVRRRPVDRRLPACCRGSGLVPRDRLPRRCRRDGQRLRDGDGRGASSTSRSTVRGGSSDRAAHRSRRTPRASVSRELGWRSTGYARSQPSAKSYTLRREPRERVEHDVRLSERLVVGRIARVRDRDHAHPAAFAERIPPCESSTAAQRPRVDTSRRAASR